MRNIDPIEMGQQVMIHGYNQGCRTMQECVVACGITYPTYIKALREKKISLGVRKKMDKAMGKDAVESFIIL